jgi:hypothetical protein
VSIRSRPAGASQATPFGRRHIFAAATALIALAPTAAHAAAPGQKLERAYQKAYDKAEHADLRPGRNILKFGIEVPGPNRPARTGELRRSLGVLRRVTAAPAGGDSTASAALEAIAACESGGDPTAVDASGTYRGKYQFDMGTWASVGGSGDPAAAPEAEQDRRAQMLMDRAGSSPWPVCG